MKQKPARPGYVPRSRPYSKYEWYKCKEKKQSAALPLMLDFKILYGIIDIYNILFDANLPEPSREVVTVTLGNTLHLHGGRTVYRFGCLCSMRRHQFAPDNRRGRQYAQFA